MLVEEKMFPSKTLNLCAASLALLVAGISVGCSQTPRKAPDVSGNIRQSLDQAGFKDVSVTQDREKGVLTLGGHVAADGDKAKAESIATSLAGGQVVSDQIAVIPLGGESAAKAVNSDLDGGIAKNLDAALIQVFRNASVEIRIYGLGGTFAAQRNHCNLVGHNLSAGEGRCNGFRFCLVAVSRDVSAQGQYALLAILSYGNIFEAGLIQRLANVARNVGCLPGRL